MGVGINTVYVWMDSHSVIIGEKMNKPTYRTTVGLNPESRDRLDQLVEKTDRSIREIIQSGINREHEEVIKE